MIEKMPHGVSLHGRVVLRGGKFDKYFSVAVPTGVSADDLKKCFADAGVNMAILLRLFDKSQTEKEVFMLWKHCPVCNKDFLITSDVCPNHTGHTLTLIIPQPEIAENPTVSKFQPTEESIRPVVAQGEVKWPEMPPMAEEKAEEVETPPTTPKEPVEEVSPEETSVIEEPVAVEEEAPAGSPVVEEVKEEVKEETPGWISGE